MAYKCPVCGGPFEGKPNKCPHCGKGLRYPEDKPYNQNPPAKTQNTQQQPSKQLPAGTQAPENKQEASKSNREGKSYFDGGFFQLIGWRLLGLIITIVTIGIGYPIALCMRYRWQTNHTVIEGRRLSFNGHAHQLVGHWIKWILLSIITIGIYALWIPIKLKKWITKHTHFAN